MILAAATKENCLKYDPTYEWTTMSAFGTYIDKNKAVLFSDTKIVKELLHCTDQVAEIIKLISVLHELGHYAYGHNDEMLKSDMNYIDMETKAWTNVFRSIKAQHHMLVWTVFDYIYSYDYSPCDDTFKEKIRSNILSSSF